MIVKQIEPSTAETQYAKDGSIDVVITHIEEEQEREVLGHDRWPNAYDHSANVTTIAYYAKGDFFIFRGRHIGDAINTARAADVVGAVDAIRHLREPEALSQADLTPKQVLREERTYPCPDCNQVVRNQVLCLSKDLEEAIELLREAREHIYTFLPLYIQEPGRKEAETTLKNLDAFLSRVRSDNE